MPSIDVASLSEEIRTDLRLNQMRAGLIAYAIRLGKRPPVGIVIGFSLQIKTGDLANALTGDLSGTVNETEKLQMHIVVTQADIDAGIQLINDQAITYRRPKASVMVLGGGKKERV